MARRTKEDAEKTRVKLIHTALMLFSEKGVSHTTLNDIAKAAGVTKGAFYWHFKNKLEIFDAITQEYSEKTDELSLAKLTASDNTLTGILDAIAFYFKQLEESSELKAYFMIVYYRCEFTDEFSSLLERHKAEYTIAKKEFSFFLQQIEVDSWVNKQVGDCDLIAEILVDALSGLIMRSLLSDEFKLSEQAIKTSKFILAGGGIRL